MNKQNLEKALGGFRGLKIGLFLKDEQLIEGILLDSKPDHLIVEVEQDVMYFALNQIHAISKNAKDFRLFSESTAHVSRSNLHELLKELKYNWVTINSLSRQTFYGLLSKIADDHIVLINNEEQLYIQKAFITNIYKGEYTLSEENQTQNSQEGVLQELEIPENSERNGSNLSSSLEMSDDSTDRDSDSLEADDFSALEDTPVNNDVSVTKQAVELHEESAPELVEEQDESIESNTNNVIKSIQEIENQFRKLLNEVNSSAKSSSENDEPDEQAETEASKESLQMAEQSIAIQEDSNDYLGNNDNSNPQMDTINESIVDQRHLIRNDKEDEKFPAIEEEMVEQMPEAIDEKENSHYSAVENVLVSFPLVSKVGNIGIPTLSPFNNHELFEETRESTSTGSSGETEFIYNEGFEEEDFVLSEPRYSPSFKRKLVDSVHDTPEPKLNQTIDRSNSQESSSYQVHEFDRFQPVYDEMFEHKFNLIREKNSKNFQETPLNKDVGMDQSSKLVFRTNNEETLESQYYALMKQAERMYLQVRANRLNE
ncbi:hypothetical protein HNO89_002683 [Sporosarcina luteola]|nr:hypothetical protein [Sporosarcina luteola]